MQSQQEHLSRTLVSHSLGGPSVFRPQTWRKGQATREPADLVWWHDPVAALFFLTSTRKSLPRDKQWPATLSAISHNLKQSRGALRHWRGGKPIVGGNSFLGYRIDHALGARALVVSVVDCDRPVAHFHPGADVGLDVNLAITLPMSFLVRFAELGCSFIDLVQLCRVFQRSGCMWSERDSQALLQEYVEDQLLLPRKVETIEEQVTPERLERARLRLRHWVLGVDLARVNEPSKWLHGSWPSALASVASTNEMTLGERIMLSVAIDIVRESGTSTNRRAILRFSTGFCEFLVCGAPDARPPTEVFQGEMFKQLMIDVGKSEFKRGSIIMVDYKNGIEIGWEVYPHPMSRVLKILDSMGAPKAQFKYH